MPLNENSKHRPVLTIAMMRHIIKLAKLDIIATDKLDQDLSIAVAGTLAPFIAKVEYGIKQPVYTTTDRPSLMETLESIEDINHDTKEDYWKQCFYKYRDDPLSCTLEQIAAAKEHMYLNDLMSDVERAAFELEDGTNHD